MSKYVENYWVEELPNGVIHLLINLTQPEIYFHSYSDYNFLIAGTEEEYDNSGPECVLTVEVFLPEIKDGLYITTSAHNKDQLSFYYIPYKREWIKTRSERFLIKL